MSTFEQRILERLNQIEARIHRLEAAAGLPPLTTPAPAVPPPIAPATPVAPPPITPAPVSVHDAPTIPPSALPVAPPIAPAPHSAPRAAPPIRIATRPGVAAANVRPAPAPAKPRLSLESWIGGRWFAVLGAVAVLIAISLFLKLAYDRGLLGRIPPGLRCIIGAAFGFLLLGAGEVARRRVNAWASAGLSSAGVAGVYASVLAAYGLFSLLSDGGAFVLLALTSALGVGVAARARLAAVAIVAFAGAYLAPFLLQTPDPNPLVFPAYLLAIFAGGLTLAAWLRAGFRVVGTMVWWTTVILGGVWVLNSGIHTPFIALLFIALAWTMIHIAHVTATRPPPRPSTGDDDHTVDDPDDAFEPPRRWRVPPVAETWLILSSFTFSSWATILSVLVVRAGGMVPDWVPPLGLTGVTALLGAALAGRLRVLTDTPATARERLGSALMMQAGALLITGVALLFAGHAAVIAWLALGVAAVAAGRWIHSRGLDVYGVIVLGIGTGRWLVYESWAGPMPTPWRDAFGLVFSQWMLFGFLAAAAWFAAAAGLHLNLPPEARARRRWLAVVAAAAGIFTLGAAFIHVDALGASTAAAWVTVGLVAVAGHAVGRRVFLAELGVIAMSMGAARLVLVESIASSPAGSPWLGLVVSPQMFACLIAAAAWIVAGVILSAGPDGSPTRRSVPPLAGGVILALLFVAPIHEQASWHSVLVAWLTALSAAIVLAPLRSALRLDLWSVPAGIVAASLWFGLHVLDPRIDWSSSDAPLFRHPGLIAALWLAGALGFAAWRGLRSGTPDLLRAARALSWSLAAGLLWGATSLEAGRLGATVTGNRAVQLATVSIWWAVFSVALLIVGFRARVPIVRHAGLLLMAVAGLKVVIFDLGGVPDVWRIASFLALGILMIAVAVAYAKLAGSPTLPDDRPENP